MEVRCPVCERTLAHDASLVGQAIICPTCGHRLRMPGPDEQVVDLGPAATQPLPQRPLSTAPASRFPGFGGQPDASSPLSVPRRPRSAAMVPSYTAAGVMLMIFSGLGLFTIGTYLLLLIIGGAIVLGWLPLLLTFLLVSLGSLSQILAIAGGLQMVQRRNLVLARIGAWAALYPCGPCSVLQIPVAIWALVLLYREQAPDDFSLTWGSPGLGLNRPRR